MVRIVGICENAQPSHHGIIQHNEAFSRNWFSQ